MNKQNPMRYKPIFPLLMSMAIPPMLSMLIQSLYNIVDSIFVAQLGEDALTAISLIYPIQNFSLAVCCGIGIAMNAYIARYLGAHDNETASYIASQGMLMTILHAIIFVIIGLFFITPFVELFTQNPLVIRYAKDYGMIVITLTFGSFIHIAIEKIFQATGNMLIPMIMQMTGAIVNIILDPIFIFGYFNIPALGVQGAAIATIIGQMSACILSIYFFKKYSQQIQINLKNIHIDWNIFKKLYSIALPSGTMICLPSILVSLLNGLLTTVSQTAVAFFGIYYKLQTFIYMPANGIIQGMRPIMSFNYGAKEIKRMNQTVKISLICIGTILCLGTLLFIFAPKWLLSLFNASNDMYIIGINALQILSFSFIFATIGIVISGVFESLGYGKQSLIISLLRQCIITVPLSYIMLPYLGLNGIWISFPISEIIASLIAVYYFIKIYKKIEG